MSGYTKVDNWLFDTVMPAAKPGTFKMVAAVYRTTVGWRREWAKISLSEFQNLSGTSGRHNVTKSLEDALSCGWIERQPEGNGFAYRVVVTNSNQDSNESLPEELRIVTTASHESLPEQSRIVTSNSHESLPIASNDSLPIYSSIKEKIKEKIKDNKEQEIEVEQPTPPPSYLRLIPIEMATPEFIAAVGEWLAYQHELTGRELPTRTLKNQLLTLRNYPAQTAIAMINQSINQGWKGLFDLRQSANGNGTATTVAPPLFEVGEDGRY